MKTIALLLSILPAALTPLGAQEPAPAFDTVARQVRAELDAAILELSELRARLALEKVPLTRELGRLEAELTAVRAELNDAKRELDGANLELSNLTGEIQSREAEVAYLDGLLGDFVREFEAGLHVAELQRHAELLETAKLAPDDAALTKRGVFEAQARVLTAALDRAEEALGGARFDGTAVGDDGLVHEGTFVLLGPSALFLRRGEAAAASAEQRLGSQEPTEVPFVDPEDATAAAALVATGAGLFPFDPTLGNAHRMEAVEETFVEHVKKGGPVMWPIGVLAAAALVVVLAKWIHLAFQPQPSRRKVDALLDAVGRGDEQVARAAAGELKGPLGRMLQAGVEHLHEPRELVEEVLYERVMTTRLKLLSYLPFVAICAASAPLLGLLGTVTGIINTFKMITLFGSGDVKSLSGGISEALITTEYGLIVAIPALLLHAFLSRKARGIVDRMEKVAISFLNRLERAPELRTRVLAPAPRGGIAPDPALVRSQVSELLSELLGPLAEEHAAANGAGGRAGRTI